MAPGPQRPPLAGAAPGASGADAVKPGAVTPGAVTRADRPRRRQHPVPSSADGVCGARLPISYPQARSRAGDKSTGPEVRSINHLMPTITPHMRMTHHVKVIRTENSLE